MRNPIRIVLSLAIALILAGALSQEASAKNRLFTPSKKPAPQQSSLPHFALSGDFSGVLAGQIVVDGRLYQLSPEASLYEIGKGLVLPGTAYNDRRVYITGVQNGGSVVVHSVTVRPARNMALSGVDMSAFVREKPDNSPR